MGCTGLSNEFQNQLLLMNLKKSDKQKLSQAIQVDGLQTMAQFMHQICIKAYPNSQVSQQKMGWMMIHLCCRWNAYQCLQYLLQFYFMDNPKGYMNFVNSQTHQGFTSLHLCAIWNSFQCFKVLKAFGAIDLSIKDNKLKTALQQALQYKSKKIAQILEKFRERKIQFIYIKIDKLGKNTFKGERKNNNEELNSLQIQQKQINENSQFKQQKEAINKKQAKLLQNKIALQKQLSLLFQQKVKKQIDLNIKLSLICLYVQVQQFQRQEYRTRERQRLCSKLYDDQKIMQQKINYKQQQLKQINSQMKNMQKQKLNLIKNHSQMQIQKFILSSYNQLIQLQKCRMEAVEKFKFKKIPLNNSKNRSTKKSQQSSQCIMKNLPKLPQNILQLYNKAKQSGIFIDKEFPASDASIGDSSKSKFTVFTSNSIWLRPVEIFKQEFQLFDGIDPEDIKQGSLGVCYMLATISALASNPKNIKKIFVFYDLNVGFYVLRLYTNGIPKYFVIDDLIPCNKTTKSPLFTQPIGKQIWVLLIEKAWAKMIGSYLNAQSMTPDYLMQDLSGAPAYGWWLTKQKFKAPLQKINQIVAHISMDHIVVITSVANQKIQGIVNNHAYSLLDVIEYNGRYVFKIRNPWGKFQWNGQYSQNSSACTQNFKKLVSFDNKDDGIFFISQNQLLKAFCFYSISHIKSDYFYSYVEFKSKKYENLYYKIKINKPGQINIRVTQLFDRMVNQNQYKYSPIIFQIGRIVNQKQLVFISECHQRTYFGAKSVHLFQNIFHYFDSGQYFIRVKMLWHQQKKYNSAVLGVYAAQQINIEKLNDNQGTNYLKCLLYSYSMINSNPIRIANGTYKIATMKGQFIFIAQTEQILEHRVRFKFIKQKMIKTQTDLGKINEQQLQTVVSKNNYGVCSAARMEPVQGGTTGPVSISFTKN